MPLFIRSIVLTGPQAEVDAELPGHLEQLRTLRAAGQLRIAGAFPNGGGFLEIFEAADLLEAERIARASPLVVEGLGAWTIRRWEELEL